MQYVDIPNDVILCRNFLLFAMNVAIVAKDDNTMITCPTQRYSGKKKNT